MDPSNHLARTLLACAVLAPALPAQNQWIVSTTSDAGSPSVDLPFLEDGDLLVAAPGSPVRPFLTSGHWLGLCDLVPADVDAVGFTKGLTSWSHALLFSTLSDVGGFRDGDVLGLLPGGGIDVVLAEADLAAALGTSAAIDVDALDVDSAGRLHFSLQNDLSTSVVGPISNGDVLRLELDGSVNPVAREADVQQALAAATGSSSTIGDVHGIALLAGDVVAVCVQSPSAYDGTLFSIGSAPVLLSDESQLGLGGEELDAIAAAPLDQRPLVGWFESSGLPGQGRLVLEGQPGEPVVAVASGTAGYLSATYFPGFGAFYLDPADPALNAQLSGAGPVVVLLDGSGRYETSVALPAAGAGLGFDGSAGWTFQFLSATSAELSAPLRVQI